MSASGRTGWKRILKAVAWSLAYLLLGFLLSGLGTVLIAALQGGASLSANLKMLSEPGIKSALVQGLTELFGFGLATWIIGVRILKLSLPNLRWFPPSRGLRGLGWGLVLGAVPAAAAVALSMVIGGARFLPDAGSLGDYLRQVAVLTLVLAPAALGEEVIFRGVPQVVLGKALGRGGALLLLSVLFGLAHLLNPGNPDALAIGNIALAGIFLGLAFYCPGGIWTAFGAHLGWNATLAAADAPVSGLPFSLPYINYFPGGPSWLTGGGFGPEAGLVATVVITGAILVTARRAIIEKETP